MSEQPHGKRTGGGEKVRHWLIILWLTLLGLFVAEMPVLSETRDRVYLWLQKRLVRSHESVIVLAIDQEEFYRGKPKGVRPINRDYLAEIMALVAAAKPRVIGLDVGLETNTPDESPQPSDLTKSELGLLSTLNEIGRTQCPIVLPRTIVGEEEAVSRRYDLYDALPFSNDANVTTGHTSSAHDHRQIPTRVTLANGDVLDSFPVAVLRHAVRKLPAKLEDPEAPWPYSFFLPNSAFVPRDAPVGKDGLLTIAQFRAASATQRREWLEHEVVLIGGTWRVNPHGGDLLDGHETPRRELPGVVLHANYIQSLLWDAMYALPRPWRLAIEILLAFLISVVFHFARGWSWRMTLVIGTLIAVVFFTWVFSAAIGLFFDMVVPVAFLGVHAVWEGASENLRLEFRRKFRYARQAFTTAVAIALVVTGALFVRHELRASEKELQIEDRLQVTDVMRPPSVRSPAVVPAYAQITPPMAPPTSTAQDDKKRIVTSPVVAPRPAVTASNTLSDEHHSSNPKAVATTSTSSQEGNAPRKREVTVPTMAQLTPPPAVGPPTPPAPASVVPAITIARLPSELEPRLRVTQIARAGSSLAGYDALLTVTIDHPAALEVPSKTIAFAGASTRCGLELLHVLEQEFARNGAKVVEYTTVAKLGVRPFINVTRSDAIDIGREVGPGALVFVKVNDCGATGLKATLQVVDLTTGRNVVEPVIDVPRRRSSSVSPGLLLPSSKEEEALVAELTTQASRFFLDWVEIRKFGYFAKAECGIQGLLDHVRTGDLDGAARLADVNLDVCISMSPVDPGAVARAHHNRGVAQFLLGNEPLAQQELAKAQSLDSDLADAVITVASPGLNDETVEKRLRILEEAYQRKLITRQEYLRKKAQLLGER